MVLIALTDTEIANDLSSHLQKHQAKVDLINPMSVDQFLLAVCSKQYSVIIVSSNHSQIDQKIWHKIIISLSAKSTILLYDNLSDQFPVLDAHQSITKLNNSFTVEEVAEYIQKYYGLGPGWYLSQKIPLINHSSIKNTLAKNNIVHLFLINGKAHSNIYTEYGVKIHSLMIEVFSTAVKDAWEKLEVSSEDDLIFSQDVDSNIYFIFSRLEKLGSYPTIGYLEQISYKLYSLIDKKLQKIIKDQGCKSQELEGLMNKVSSFTVGYSSLLQNRCFNFKDHLRVAIKKAKQNSELMKHRKAEIERELLSAIIARPEMLFTRYQGVFDVELINEQDIQRYKNKQYNSDDYKKLYGFESLLGIQKNQVSKFIEGTNCHLDVDDLNPMSLFDMAKKSELSLELDQVCISMTSKAGDYLPGKLLVNIFPRNLYYIEKFIDIIPRNIEIIFEIAESRIIKNSDFLLDAKTRLKDINIEIATDDVSKGFANFKRLLSLNPDLIKLDRDLIFNADKNPRKASIIKLLTEYSKKFGHKILAEGIESVEEYRLCKKLKVDYMQGFLLHVPADIATIKNQFSLNFRSDASKDQTKIIKKIKQTSFSNEDSKDQNISNKEKKISDKSA